MKNLYLLDLSKPFNGVVTSSITRNNKGEFYVDYSSELYNDNQGNLTLAEYQRHVNPFVEVIDDAKLDQLLADYEKSRITQPVVITADRFYEMLEILPPQRWHNCGGFEVFHIQEHITGDLVAWFAYREDQYFEFIDSCYISDVDLIRKLFTAFNS